MVFIFTYYHSSYNKERIFYKKKKIKSTRIYVKKKNNLQKLKINDHKLFFFHHTTRESTCDTLASSAANQGDNTVSVAQGGTETVLSPWLVADEARVSHVLSHVV